MKRKIVSVLMCATMTAALFAGCGGGGDTQASGDAAKTSFRKGIDCNRRGQL